MIKVGWKQTAIALKLALRILAFAEISNMENPKLQPIFKQS